MNGWGRLMRIAPSKPVLVSRLEGDLEQYAARKDVTEEQIKTFSKRILVSEEDMLKIMVKLHSIGSISGNSQILRLQQVVH